MKDVDIDLWYAFFVPAKTPAATVAKLNTAIAAILQQTDVKELLGKVGMDAEASTPEARQAVVAKDHPRWGAVIQRNGIKAE